MTGLTGADSSGVAAHADGGVVLGGRYRLGERVGAGGMATIHRATDLTLERDVAVKVLHSHLADETAVLERFRTEAQHAAALAHPHVVSVFDQGGEGPHERPYMVMEFVDGPSLRQVIRQRGRVSPREALALIDPVCRALQRAHELGMVHRDVKPENVLVTRDGVVKVVDFGIARAIESSQHTQSGALVGSVHYLAPELVGEQRASPASDQYAVGVMVFELLTGRKALPADSPVGVALRHARERVPAPSTHASDVPPALDAAVRRACAPDPGDRFPDLAAFLGALHQALPEGPLPVSLPRDDGGDATVVLPVEDTPVPPSRSPDLRRSPVPRGPDRPWRRRLRRGGIVLGTLLASLAVMGAGALAAYHWLIAPVIAMPSLEDQQVEQATDVLDSLGLVPTLEWETTHDVEEGTVIGQDPPAGEELRRGSDVELIVSEGPADVEVPDVEDGSWSSGEARQLLESDPYHFEVVEVEEVFDDEIPEGNVIRQSLEPGEEVAQGSELSLEVSRGVRQVEVPDLSGLTRSEAEAALADADLEAAIEEEHSDSVPTPDEVISQSLDPGEEIDEGSTVEVVVSAGPLTIELPDLRGEPVEAAVASLEAEGLAVEVVREPRPSVGPFVRGQEGLVEETDPTPGSAIERGQQVVVYTFDDDA